MDRLGSESHTFLTVVLEWRRRKETYHKQRCRCCRAIQQAPAPYRLLQGSSYDRTVWADFIAQKFDMAMPYYRIEDALRQQGINITRSTIARGLVKIAGHLRPLEHQLRQHVLAGNVIHVDETRLPVLDPGAGKPHTGYMWVYLRDEHRSGSNVAPGVFFEYAPGRGQEYPERTLSSSDAQFLSLDGYDGYNAALGIGRDEIAGWDVAYPKRAACNAHARRRFVKSQEAAPSELAETMIALYGEAYAIEKRTWILPPGACKRRRQAEIKPIFDKMEALLRAHVGQVLSKSSLGCAISYWLDLRKDLTRFLEDGRVEIDNNLVENAIRRLVVIRKNSLFAGSPGGADAWALYSSLVGTCRLNKIDPLTYFDWLFGKIEGRHPVARYDELLPWHCPVGKRRP